MPTAYIDESQMRGTGSGGTYFLGATILETMKLAPEMRDMLVRLKPKTHTKLHWYDAVRSLRMRTMELISTFDVDHLVIEHGAAAGEATERSRRYCIERMMHELEGFGVDHVVLESRGRADDRRDMQMLDSLRAKRQVKVCDSITFSVIANRCFGFRMRCSAQ